MLCFIFSALVIALDQIFKQWIVITIPYNPNAVSESITIIPGVLELTHVKNPGVALGMLAEVANIQWVLVGAAVLCCLILIFILRRYTDGFWGSLGLAAVLGGAVGNLLDRVFRSGLVVDMFQFKLSFFPYIFNIADIFITLGGLTFCVHFLVMSFKNKKPSAPAAVRASYKDPYGGAEAPSSDTQVRRAGRQSKSQTREQSVPEDIDLSETKVIPAQTDERPEPAPAAPPPSPPPEAHVPEEFNAEYDDALLKDLGISLEDYDMDSLLSEYGLESDKD